jgi:lipopolysaccharide/colanic/teichoic acid biosynthesis glycosyltransferase
MKRLTDIIFSAALILLSSPLLIITYLVIKSSSLKESVFFTQERVGKGQKLFRFYKFRTMCSDSGDMSHREYIKKWIKENKPYTYDDKGRPIYKMMDDPRITKEGKILRRFHIDELPQLFNVLRGNMSMVGPRPAIPYELEHYEKNDFQRFSVLPGITGIWQAEGNKMLSFRDMIDMDLFYVENKSFWLDIKILVKTLFTVLGITTDWRIST